MSDLLVAGGYNSWPLAFRRGTVGGLGYSALDQPSSRILRVTEAGPEATALLASEQSVQKGEPGGGGNMSHYGASTLVLGVVLRGSWILFAKESPRFNNRGIKGAKPHSPAKGEPGGRKRRQERGYLLRSEIPQGLDVLVQG